MAGIINFDNEVRQVNVTLESLRQNLTEVLNTTKRLDQEFEEGAGDSQKLAGRLKEVDSSIDQLTASEKELQRVQDQINKIITKTNVERKKEGQDLKRLQVLRSQQNQVMKNEILLKQASTKEGRKLNETLKRQREELSKIRGSSGGLRNALKSVIGGFLGITAVVYGAIKAIGGIVKLNADFQKSLSSLSAITGATGEDLQFFAETAKETSKTTLQSANDVLKAYELVGSIRPELLKNKEALAEVTEQAIILSEATGGKLGLEDAAVSVAGALNQYGLASSDAARVSNVLAAGSKAGSAAVLEQTEAIKVFGAVANAGNVSLEQSVGLIETLAEKQITGAEAGTKLRNVLITLQGDQRNYRDGVFDVDLALENLAKRNLSTTQLTRLFGKQNVVAAQILAKNTQAYHNYTEAVTGTNTALEQQAIQNDNLRANWKRLTNIVSGFFIRTGEGGGILNNVVKYLINLVSQIEAFVGQFVQGFNDLIRSSALFRAGIKALGQAVRLNFQLMLKGIRIVIEPFLLLGRIIKDALTGNFEDIRKRVPEALNNIKTNAIALKDVFVDSGKTIAAAYKGEDIESLLIKTKKGTEEVEQATISATNQVEAFTTEYKKSAEEIKKEQDKIRKAQEKAEKERKDRVNKQISEFEFIAESEILANKKALFTKQIDEEEFARRSAELQIQNLNNQLGIMELSKEERLKIEQELLDAQLELEDQRLEKVLENEEKIKEAKKETQAVLFDIGNALFELGNTLRDRELADLDAQEAYKLNLVQGNEEAQQRIREDFDRKRAAIKRKQAITDKIQGIFNAGINTALGVTQALGSSPPPANFILAAVVAALGAIQIGIIAAKPIPQFYKGVKGFEGGLAEVGERGFEIVRKRSGEMFLTPDSATLTLLPPGSDVIPHEDSKELLQGGITPERFDLLLKETRATRKAIIGRPIKETSLTDRGLRRAHRHNNSVTVWIDTYLRK